MKTVKITVVDEIIHGAGVSIGAVGSHGETIIEAQFSEVWEGKGKVVTWTNAIGEKAVITIISPDMLVENTDNAYRFEVPAEATTHAGMASISIKGTTVDSETGVELTAITTEDAFFKVRYSVGGVSESDDVSASNAERLLSEMEAIITLLKKSVGDNVKKYNDLGDRPTTYIEEANLDELLEPGVYTARRVSGSGIPEGVDVFDALYLIFVADVGSLIQMIWTPSGIIYRSETNGDWSTQDMPYVIKGQTMIEYNELTNRPFNYVSNLNLDDVELESVKRTYYFDTCNYQDSSVNTNIPGIAVVFFIGGGGWYQTIYTSEFITQRRKSYLGEGEYGDWETQVERKLAFENDAFAIAPQTLTFDEDGLYRCYLDLKLPKIFITLDNDFSFVLPTVEKQGFTDYTGEFQVTNWQEGSILVYAYILSDISIDWGSDVLFYNNEIPEIGIGYYDIIFTYDPNAQKWCVGVIPKGAVE